MKALVLVKVTSLQSREAYRLLMDVNAVVESYLLYGRYDLALVLQVKNLQEIRQIIFSHIQPIPGVMDILPCIIADDAMENCVKSPVMRHMTI